RRVPVSTGAFCLPRASMSWAAFATIFAVFGRTSAAAFPRSTANRDTSEKSEVATGLSGREGGEDAPLDRQVVPGDRFGHDQGAARHRGITTGHNVHFVVGLHTGHGDRHLDRISADGDDLATNDLFGLVALTDGLHQTLPGFIRGAVAGLAGHRFDFTGVGAGVGRRWAGDVQA